MARVTVEDCILQVPNRFELVMFAAQRARDISAGAQITLDRDRDKNPVVALREIAETKLDQGVLKDSLISGMQKHADIDKPEEVNEMAELEQELAAAQSVFPRAEAFGVHALIDPRTTRARLCDWLDEIAPELLQLARHAGPRRYGPRP